MLLKFSPLVVLILIQNFSFVFSSDGDRSPFYQKCVGNCLNTNCTTDGAVFLNETAHLQEFWSGMLQWSCRDECRYHCMWKTVSAFSERGYNIPKFHGKWPFKRLFGVQEPASAFCSLLNLAAHVYMYFKISEDMRFSIVDTPFVFVWYVFMAVCVNAWVWSAIFHTRDTPFTEFMDYACALSMVMGLFVTSIVRVFDNYRLILMVLICTLIYYVEHVRYLYAGSIDYEYNMIVNIVCGVAGSALWLCWGLRRVWRGCPYAWRLVLFMKLSGAALMLELFDFPPFLHAWDAHALWHLSTAPLPLLFYRFVIDDMLYMDLEKPWPSLQKMNLKIA